MRDYQKSVTTKKVWLPDRRTDRQTPDKVIPMCHYASQATQKVFYSILIKLGTDVANDERMNPINILG